MFIDFYLFLARRVTFFCSRFLILNGFQIQSKFLTKDGADDVSGVGG